MKNLFLTLAVVCLAATMAYSQTDTIYKKSQKIPCKIVEVNETDIKYKMAGMEDGPLYVISKSSVLKYRLANGYTENVLRDELSLENEHMEIIKNRRAVKFTPFSFVNSHVAIAYEKVLKVGMNLDIEVGYSNSNINSKSPLFSNNFNYPNANPFCVGAYIKPGVKFFLGQDFSVKGLKYAHPLKGRYIRLDLVASYLNFQRLIAYDYMTYSPWSPPVMTHTVGTNLNVATYGGFVNYGRQFILGNMFTFEYYIGAGFTAISYSYSNPEYLKAQLNTTTYYYRYNSGDNPQNINNYYSFFRTGNVGLSLTAGFRLGYIIPEKSQKPQKKPVTN